MSQLKKSIFKVWLPIGLAISLFLFFTSHQVFADGAKNIIIMISDGCGYNHLDSTSMYQYGKTGVQVYERFPIKYAMSTYPAGAFNADGTWQFQGSYDPNLIWKTFGYAKLGWTDSAPAATTMSTGVKSYNGAIGVDPNKKPLKHISQQAKEMGKSVGIITTVEFSHATPAGFLAHNVDRNNYAQIAQEMLLDSKADVIMGCGNPVFDSNGQPTAKKEFKYVGGEAVWNSLLKGSTEFDLNGDGKAEKIVQDIDGDGKPDAWTLIQDKAEFQSLMNGATPKRVLGVPMVFDTLQDSRSAIADRNGDGKIDTKDVALATPYEDPLVQGVPNLEEMSVGTINVLDKNPKGFFLMIEGGAIDWAAHANTSARTIEEEIDFNKAVEAVIDWIQKNSNWNETLLIVTGDHETGYLTGPGSGPDPDDPSGKIAPTWKPIVNNGAGKLPGMEWHSLEHTNSLIPLFAKGAGSSLFNGYANGNDPVRGAYIDNANIANVIFELLAMPSVDYGNVFFMNLDSGLNMVSLPLMPAESLTSKSFADMIGATVVIKLDDTTHKFVGYVPGSPTNAFPIEGGKGYIVNVDKPKTVTFTGAAWTNTPTYEAAPGLVKESAWAFVVDGKLGSSDANLNGYTIQLKNLRTESVLTDSVSSQGYFILASADLSRNSIIQTGDDLKITLKNSDGKVITELTTTVDGDSINKAHLNIPIKLGEMRPSQTSLLQNYPNPFNPETWIPFQLSEDSNVKINIYDMQGKLIRSFVMGRQSAGIYDTHDKAIHWDGRNESGEVVGSGVYFYELQTGKFSSIKKMIVKK